LGKESGELRGHAPFCLRLDLFPLRRGFRIGTKAITNRLNRSGFVTKEGNAFGINTVRQILKNVVYIGKIRFYDPEKQSEEIAQGEHEPIIPLPLWEEVQQRLRENSGRPKKQLPHEFILASILRCPACGSGMIGSYTTATRKNGSVKRYVYYICSKYHNKGSAACKPNHVQALAVENEVLNRLKQLITHPRLIGDIVDRVNRQTKLRLQFISDQMQQIDKQLKDSNAQKKQVFELFEMDLISQQELSKRLGSIKESLAEFEHEKARLKHEQEAERRKEISLPQIQNALEQFELLWQPTPFDQKRRLLRNMIEKITFGEGKTILIHLKEVLFDICLPLADTVQQVS
jgi:site-specific DNA recombinase